MQFVLLTLSLGHMSTAPSAKDLRLTSPLRQPRMSTPAKAAELSPDLTAASMSNSASANSQRDKEKYQNLSDDESEQITKIKTKHLHRTKDSSDDRNSSSASASASSNTDSPAFFDDPVARVKAVERGTWVRLALLMLSLAMLFFAWHPTASYRVQLYFGHCVEIPRSGFVHKICPPQTIPHPLQ